MVINRHGFYNIQISAINIELTKFSNIRKLNHKNNLLTARYIGKCQIFYIIFIQFI